MKLLMIYGCHSIDGDDVAAHHSIFRRLHLFCGAYGDMYDSWTIDEAGDDTANNLISGRTVCDSWGDGNPLWEETVIGCDHLLGVHGLAVLGRASIHVALGGDSKVTRW